MDDFLHINIGQIAVMLSVLGSAFIFVGSIRQDVKRQGERLSSIENEIVKLREVVVEIARQEERLNAMDQRMLMQGKRIDEILSRK